MVISYYISYRIGVEVLAEKADNHEPGQYILSEFYNNPYLVLPTHSTAMREMDGNIGYAGGLWLGNYLT